MILGIGMDMVDIERIRASLERYGDSFVSKIFTEHEITYCSAKALPAQHYAARFAAKEAFSKAIATGWAGAFHWKDVEVVNDEQGKPSFRLYGATAEQFGEKSILVSLTHTDASAAAFVIIQE
jgi:holo-[acyl-carrier protein] synthase